jgi:hypothetical protein
MSNQTLIDYENEQKQININSISTLEWQIQSVNQAIAQANLMIDSYNAQAAAFQDQIFTLQTNNVLIDEIIAILSSQDKE